MCHTGLLTACEQDQDGTAVTSWSCSQAVWHIPLLCVQWKTPDDGQRNCPKHVEFYSKNKFEKLVRLVGFIIRIYHDAARSLERQIWNYIESLLRKFTFHSTLIHRTALYVKTNTLLDLSRSILFLQWEILQVKLYGESKHTFCDIGNRLGCLQPTGVTVRLQTEESVHCSKQLYIQSKCSWR